MAYLVNNTPSIVIVSAYGVTFTAAGSPGSFKYYNQAWQRHPEVRGLIKANILRVADAKPDLGLYIKETPDDEAVLVPPPPALDSNLAEDTLDPVEDGQRSPADVDPAEEDDLIEEELELPDRESFIALTKQQREDLLLEHGIITQEQADANLKTGDLLKIYDAFVAR